MKLTVVPLVTLLAFGLAHGAFADVTLYDNGPVTDSGAWPISSPTELSNSFTLSSPSTIDAINFGASTYTDIPITSVEWSIGTSFYDASLGSGDASVTTTPSGLPPLYGTFPISTDSFSLNTPIDLAAGTYYLTLQDAIADSDGANFGGTWVVTNNGPSVAQLNDPYPDDNVGSESFQILGSNASAVPEPNGIIPLLIGSLTTGLLVYRRRRVRGNCIAHVKALNG